MKIIKCFLILYFLCLLAYPAVGQESFKGIVPIKSTCEDVRRVLGGECNFHRGVYNLPEETIHISYSTEECYGFEGRRWNVPVGTVMRISRDLKNATPPEKLGIRINKSEYDEYSRVLDIVKYKKKGGGLEVVFVGEYITNIYHTTTDADNSRICPISIDFNGFIPMKSTCHDLEKLSIGRCGTDEQTLDSEAETIKFIFTTQKCESFYGKRWNVPIGTVARIERHFRANFK